MTTIPHDHPHRTPTEEERLLARECAGVAMRAAHFCCDVAAAEATVTDELIESMRKFRDSGLGSRETRLRAHVAK